MISLIRVFVPNFICSTQSFSFTEPLDVADSKLAFVKENKIDFTGSLKTAKAEVVVAADVFIMPVFQITVAHIGGGAHDVF